MGIYLEKICKKKCKYTIIDTDILSFSLFIYFFIAIVILFKNLLITHEVRELSKFKTLEILKVREAEESGK